MLTKLQHLAMSQQLPISIKEQIVDKGWVRKPKSLLQVLWETGWINLIQLCLKYKKSAYKDNNYNEEGNIKDKAAKFALLYIMANQHNFANELTNLQ